MAKELASVRDTVYLTSQVVLDRAQALLTGQGYSVTHHMSTSLTAERYVPTGTGSQEKRTVTVIVQPQKEGGVRIKVVGDDTEGLHEHQAKWIAWSESLRTQAQPTQATVEGTTLSGASEELTRDAQAETEPVTAARNEGVLTRADGLDGCVTLLQDAVRIGRLSTDTGKIGDEMDIPLYQLSAVTLTAPTLLSVGHLDLETKEQDTQQGRPAISQRSASVRFTQEHDVEAFQAIERYLRSSVGTYSVSPSVPAVAHQDASSVPKPWQPAHGPAVQPPNDANQYAGTMTPTFCPNCGFEHGGKVRFCPGCGSPQVVDANSLHAGQAPTGQAHITTPAPTVRGSIAQDDAEWTLWEGESQNVTNVASGGRMVSSRYRLTNKALYFDQGLVTTTSQQVPLWSVRDIDVKQSLTQKVRGVGDVIVHVQRSDYTGRDFVLMASIERPQMVRDLLNQHAHRERMIYQEFQKTRFYRS